MLFLVLAASGSGCGSSVSSKELEGSYVCKYPYAIELLVLRSDQSYIQVAILDALPDPQTNRGVWQFDSKNGEVVLETPIIIDNNHGRPSADLSPQKGAWVLPVRRDGGNVVMPWQPDLDFRFEKLD